MQENKIPRESGTVSKSIMLLSAFVAMLNETSITVALSDLMRIFAVDVSTVQWLVTGFMLVTAVIVPITAYIIQRFRDRSIFFFSLALLFVGAFLAGLAPSFGFLLIARLVQAAGTCCIWALTINTMLALSSNETRGGALGLIGLVSVFAPAIAPSLAGLVLQAFGWRWIFLGMVPIFLALGIFAFLRLENTTPTSEQSLDPISVVLVALSFGGLIYGVCGIGGADARGGAASIAAFALGAVALVVFVIRQVKLESPLLDVGLFKEPMFTLGMVVVFFCNLTTMGVIVLMPMLYVQGFGLPAALAGLAVMPACILNGLSSPLLGKLIDKVRPKMPARIGACALVLSALAFAFLPRGLPLWAFIALHCAIFVAITLASTASQANGMNHVPPRSYPHGTAIMSTLIQLGGGFGSAVYATIFATGLAGEGQGLDHTQAVFAGFHKAFLCGAALLVIPLIAAFFMRGPDPAARGEGSIALSPAK